MVDIKLYIEQQIAEIEADSRFYYPPASLFSNAPLVVIQTDLKSRHKVLTDILNKLKD